MEQFFPSTPMTLDEARIAAEQPGVRAQLVMRLERLYAFAEDNMDDDGHADPRWAELAVRITDRLAKLYRLDVTVPVPEDPSDLSAVEAARRVSRSAVSSQLDALAARELGS
jgi:hypothetical protein